MIECNAVVYWSDKEYGVDGSVEYTGHGTLAKFIKLLEEDGLTVTGVLKV